MNNQKFGKILLSRFCALDEQFRYALISTLILAESELSGKTKEMDRIEDDEGFPEWAQNVMEILFPEEIGDVILLEDLL